MIAANIFTSTVVFLIGLSTYQAYPIPDISALSYSMKMVLATAPKYRELENKYVHAKEDWPEECKDKSYCHIQPAYYPSETFAKLLQGVKLDFEQSGGVGNRSSEGDLNDIADCPSIPVFEKFYLILDENDKIRFVAQNNDAFVFKIQLEECSKPGRTFSSSLDEDKLKEKRVDCFETRRQFMFPVLSLDGTKLESVTPKGGIPLSCSAKVMT